MTHSFFRNLSDFQQS